MIGVSTDTPFSQWNWLESLGTQAKGAPLPTLEGELPPLVLVSDRNRELIEPYGVQPLEINGATYASRSTFVIDKQGVLRYVNYQYKVQEDYGPLLKILSELK